MNEAPERQILAEPRQVRKEATVGEFLWVFRLPFKHKLQDATHAAQNANIYVLFPRPRRSHLC